MRIETQYDDQGNAIGIITTDDNGNRVGTAVKDFHSRPARLNVGTQTPTTITGDFRSSSQRSSSSQDSNGYTIPAELLNQDVSTSGLSQVPESTPEPDKELGFAGRLGQGARDQIQRDIEGGGIRGLKARADAVAFNVVGGLADAVDDVADFGAAIIDTVRGKEVNDDDNFINLAGLFGTPDSAIGKFTYEAASFGAAAISGGGLVKKIPTVARLAAGGLGSRLAVGTATGVVTDFVKAKNAEENIYNSFAGTPLETPVSRFLAADTDTDANLWLNKTKEAIGGAVTGTIFDAIGEGVGLAFKAFRTEPTEKLLTGVRDIRMLPPAEQGDALRKLDTEVQETLERTETLLLEAAKEVTDERITDARRLLAAADPDVIRRDRFIEQGRAAVEFSEFTTPDNQPDLSTDIGGINGPAIRAGGTVGIDEAQIRVTELEEELVKLTDLRRGLSESGLVGTEETGGVLTTDLDSVILEVQTELDAYSSMVSGQSSVIPDTFGTSIERGQLNRELNRPKIDPNVARGDTRDLEVIREAEERSAFERDLRVFREARDSELSTIDSRITELQTKIDDVESKLEGSESAAAFTDAQARAEELDDILGDLNVRESDISNQRRRIAPRVDEELERQAKEVQDEFAKYRAEYAEIDKILESKPNTPVSNDDLFNELDTLETQMSDLVTQRQEINQRVEPTYTRSSLSTPEETFTPAADREPNIIGGEGVGRRETLRTEDGPGRVPDREPNIIGGRPTVEEGRVGNPRGRYRTKTEVRKDVAKKTVKDRVDSANTDKPSNASTKPAETPKSSTRVNTPKPPKKPSGSSARAIRMSRKDLRNTLTDLKSDKPTDRFVNIDKLTDSEDSKEAVEFMMSAIKDTKLEDTLTDDQLNARARRIVRSLSFIGDEDEMRGLIKAYAGVTSNVPVAQRAIRILASDMADQISASAKSLSKGKKLGKMTIAEMTADVDFMHKLSRFEYFLTLNKNLGKVQAQGMRARGVKLTDEILDKSEAAVEYERVYGAAVENTPTPDDYNQRLLALLETPEGREKFDKIKTDISRAETIDELADATRVSEFIAKSQTVSNLVQGVRMNAILSGTRTNMTNLLSGAVMSVYVPATQAAGAVIDMPYQVLRGNTDGVIADKKALGEALGTLSGLIQYSRDSAKMAKKAFIAGESIIGRDQILEEADRIELLQALDTKGLNLPKALAHTLSIPSRLLVTGDEFFKQLNYRSHVRSRAVQDALSKGLTGNRLTKYVDQRVNDSFMVDPDTGIQGLAKDTTSYQYAEFVTFQQNISQETSLLRDKSLKVIEAIENVPGMRPITRLFVPFIKTPANIMAYTARNSPLGMVSKEWRADYAAGGSRRARALGEYTLGSTAVMGITALAMQGKLTGRAPSDPGQRELWYAQGYQPYSIRVGNKWVSFERMEPFAGHFGIVADMVNATSIAGEDDSIFVEEANANIIGAFVAAVRNRTFFQGLSDLIDVYDSIGSTDSRDMNKVSSVIENIAATLLPYSSLLNEQRRARDLTLREAEGVVEKVMDKVPGWSTSLPPRVNWLTGKPVTYGSNPVMNLYPSSYMKDDPLIKKLLRYNVSITPPDRTVKNIELDNVQYSKYLQITGQIEIAGKTQYQALQDVFDSFDTTMLDAEIDYIRADDDYAGSSPLAVEVRKVRSQYTKAAQAALVQIYPELATDIRDRLLESEFNKEGLFWLNSPLYEGLGTQTLDDSVNTRINEATQQADDNFNRILTGPGTPTVRE